MTTSKPRPTTTDAGIPVASQEHSLTVGPDGPILLGLRPALTPDTAHAPAQNTPETKKDNNSKSP
jgi:catalase